MVFIHMYDNHQIRDLPWTCEVVRKQALPLRIRTALSSHLPFGAALNIGVDTAGGLELSFPQFKVKPDVLSGYLVEHH